MRARVWIAVLVVVLSVLLGVGTTYVSAWVMMNLPAGREGLEAFASSLKAVTVKSTTPSFGVRCASNNAQYEIGKGLVLTGVSAPGVVMPSWSVAGRAGLSIAPQVVSGTLLERAGGWPMPAVVERMFRGSSGLPFAAAGHDWTVRRANHVNPWMRRTLAFMPVWPGFAVNAALFTAVWLVLIGRPVVRRWMRAAAGQCEKCRYDLSGLKGDVCPECGERVGGDGEVGGEGERK